VENSDEEIRRGWMTIRRVRTGARVFLGNDSVLPPGADIPTKHWSPISIVSKRPAKVVATSVSRPILAPISRYQWRRIVLPRAPAGTTSVHSGFYLRKWTVGLACEVMLETRSAR
jgi:hypothetical protein